MSKNQQKIAAVIALLQAAGYVPAGETTQETVRIPTVDNPVLGTSGGKLATLGGRQRWAIPGSPLRVTVGAQTTNIYAVLPKEKQTLHNKIKMIAMYKTGDVQQIEAGLLVAPNFL